MIRLVFLVATAVCLSRAEVLDGDASSADPMAKELVKSFVEQRLNAMSNSIYRSRVSKVTKLTQVEGDAKQYQIEFEFARTLCTQYSMIALATCPLGNNVQLCTSSVSQIESGAGFSLDDFNCRPLDKNVMQKRAGGIHKVSNPKEYMDTAVRAIALHNDAAKLSNDETVMLSNMEVVSVRTQVVSGKKIFLTVKGDAADGSKQTCDITVWSQPWLSDGFQVLDLQCKDGMQKRAGGIRKVDNPKDYMDTAVRAIALHNDAAKLSNDETVLFDGDIKIKEASTQVVAGTMIRLTVEGAVSGENTECKLSVWSRPWLGDDANFLVRDFKCKKISKRGLTLGGIHPTGGVSGELGAKDRAQFADTAVLALNMKKVALKNMEVVSVRTQVVSGKKIFLTVKGDAADGSKQTCDITVWSRPWLSDGFQVLNLKCKNSEEKRALGKLGGGCAGCVGDEVKNPDDYMGIYLQAFAAANTNMDINNSKILSVRTQVVAGTRYYMKVQTSEAGEPRLCDVDFVEQPWNNPSINVLKFDCKPIN